MLKTFVIGIFSGAVIAALLLNYLPLVDQHREISLISVQANGGNTETFHTNLPEDRVFSGAAGRGSVPPDVKWPEDRVLADVHTELFKVRNRNDIVVGVASRILGPVSGSGTVTEWVLHLPARGTVYISMDPVSPGATSRNGVLRAGTREFAGLKGAVNERFIARKVGGTTRPEGRVELLTSFVSARPDQESGT